MYDPVVGDDAVRAARISVLPLSEIADRVGCTPEALQGRLHGLRSRGVCADTARRALRQATERAELHGWTPTDRFWHESVTYAPQADVLSHRSCPPPLRRAVTGPAGEVAGHAAWAARTAAGLAMTRVHTVRLA